jgi:mannose-6-phosphate isomerase-like protein (cupin superfamily)
MSTHILVSVAASLVLLSCQQEGLPATQTPAAAASAPPTPLAVVAPAVVVLGTPTPVASTGPTPTLAPPVMAKLVDVASAGAKVPVGTRCDFVFVAVAKGAITAAGQSLALGDTLMASGLPAPGNLDLAGSGLAVVVSAPHDTCAAGEGTTPVIHVARAGDAKDLAWANGAMHAHIDFEKDASPDIYVGRLEGTAPVAEHDHGPSWEVLCAIQGSGTFTIDGVPTHLADHTIIAVPPGRRHSWQPDPGSKLVAVQVYAPRGPEQRFRALAAAH